MGMIIIWDTKKEQQKLNRMWDERPKTVYEYIETQIMIMMGHYVCMGDGKEINARLEIRRK